MKLPSSRKKRQRNPSASTPQPTKVPRYVVILLTCIVAAVCAALVTYRFAIGLSASPYVSIETVGRLEIARLPIGARRLRELKSFVITMGGADDYGRVYVNNHLVLNREAPDLFYKINESEENKRKAAIIVERKESRNVNMLGSTDVIAYLQPGVNFIVVELDNAVAGCVLSVDIRVNGTQLEGFPKGLPDYFKLDQETSQPALAAKLQASQRKHVALGMFAPNSDDDAFCSRRIFQIHLE